MSTYWITCAESMAPKLISMGVTLGVYTGTQFQGCAFPPDIEAELLDMWGLIMYGKAQVTVEIPKVPTIKRKPMRRIRP